MAMTRFDMQLLVALAPRLNLSQAQRVLDCGLQELRCAGDTDLILRYLRAFRPQAALAESDVRPFAEHCYVKELYGLIDVECVALDVYGPVDFTFFDFNHEKIPKAFEGSFDLVTNFGTSEHVLNQFNVFQQMHAATRVGGHMFHALPFSGFTDHGLFNYNPKFFMLLAENNRYRLMDSSISVVPDQYAIHPEALRLLNGQTPLAQYADAYDPAVVAERFRATLAGLRVLLEKTEDRPFCPPVDCVDMRQVSVDRMGILARRPEESRRTVADLPVAPTLVVASADPETAVALAVALRERGVAPHVLGQQGRAERFRPLDAADLTLAADGFLGPRSLTEAQAARLRGYGFGQAVFLIRDGGMGYGNILAALAELGIGCVYAMDNDDAARPPAAMRVWRMV